MTAIILTDDELKSRISDLLVCRAAELVRRDADTICIPYMMNDALEDYLTLHDCAVTGKFCDKMPDGTICSVARENGRSGLIFHLPDGGVFTIWYSSCEERKQCYRYDGIGHFWVRGEEHWRRLVYMIGTMYDKFHFIGDSVCSEKEKALIPLMGFAPFRYWSPLGEPLDDYYSDSHEGSRAMLRLAEECSDQDYIGMLHLYSRFRSAFFTKKMAHALLSPKREPLYQLLLTKVSEAASAYPARSYGREKDRQIDAKRAEVTAQLYARGFGGTYPSFSRGDTDLFCAEEQPFTVLDSENYTFSIHIMITRKSRKVTGHQVIRADEIEEFLHQ